MVVQSNDVHGIFTLTPLAEDVFEDALVLNADEREQLARLLIEQPARDWATPEIEQAWQEECV